MIPLRRTQKFILLALILACWGKSRPLPFTKYILHFSKQERKLQRQGHVENRPLTGVGWLKFHLTKPFLAFLAQSDLSDTGCLLNWCFAICIHVSSGYEPSEGTVFRSLLEQQIMKTCSPFLQISSEPRGPGVWETGKKKGGREFGFCILLLSTFCKSFSLTDSDFFVWWR